MNGDRDAFRRYDAAALNAQYIARDAVPAFGAYAKRWQETSAKAVDDLPCKLDIAFGESAAETLDIFPALDGGPAPVLVFYHGGYWRSADKAWFRFLARPFVERGVTVVLPNYGLCPAVTMDEIAGQCRRSFEWIWLNAASFGGDEARLFVSGHSAGGQIAAMLLADDWSGLGSRSGFPIKGVTAVSGLFDLEPIRLTSLNDDLRMDKAAARRNSPVDRPLPASSPPIIAAVGALESDEFRRQNRLYGAHAEASAVDCTVLEVAGHHHYSILDAMANPRHPFGRMVLNQIGAA
ncbi:alpha/beta hydrolase [Martelella soudanensis]|uniref:alpha/beta hydrolase n=1 Tax=unclassified Martelella TaxID=2629616 RepID=UPI0015DFB522|nr:MULTISPECIES: alpha/beta hydrolase [unclassified Martelella]